MRDDFKHSYQTLFQAIQKQTIIFSKGSILSKEYQPIQVCGATYIGLQSDLYWFVR